MNQKQRQRWGRTIASTLLCCAALSLATFDKAQAAILTYDFSVGDGGLGGFFKFSNSSLTGIGSESIAVSEGRLNGLTASFGVNYQLQGKEFYDLAGAIALFDRGEFQGLQASGSDSSTREIDIPEASGGPYYIKYTGSASWNMANNGPFSLFWGYSEVTISDKNRILAIDRGAGQRFDYVPITYTLVDTAAEPVPEPITFAGTALAIAGLSWLKHKKKTAV